MAIKGAGKVKKWLLSKGKEIEKKVVDLVDIYTGEIEQQAINNAPGAGDFIKTTYGSQQIQDNIRGFIYKEFSPDGLTGRVGVSSGAGKFFVYVEFSTGPDAARYIPTLPKEFQDFARRFYVNGKGTIIGQPFLLPAYFKNRNEFIKELNKLIK